MALKTYAQGLAWKPIGTFPFHHFDGQGLGGLVDCIFFYDTLHGVVSYGEVTEVLQPPHEHMYYTKDKRTWKASVLPPGITRINAIRHLNGKLYAATTGLDAIVSNDSGATWNFAGLGIGDAGDIYTNASGVVRKLKKVRSTFARVDPLHCLQTHGGDGLDSVGTSSDGGDTWNYDGLRGSGFSCYGDTCGKFFLYHTLSELYRSSDFGKTWQSEFDNILSSQHMEGYNGVIYTNPNIRSVDYGKTWQTVDYGNNCIYWMGAWKAHFPVFGPMGNCVVAAYENTVYMTMSGGDGNLHSPINTDPMWLGDTVRLKVGDEIFWGDSASLFSTCPAFQIPIPLYSAVDGITTTIRIVQDSLHEFAFRGDSNFKMHTDTRDTAWIIYDPHVLPGRSTVKFAIHNKWHCSDWDESRVLVVTSPPMTAVEGPAPFSGSCNVLYGSGRLRLFDSCQSIVVTSLTSSLPDRLTPLSIIPDTVRLGRHDTLHFRFNPRDTNAQGDVMIGVHGYYLGTAIPYDTTLTVPITAVYKPSVLLHEPVNVLPDSISYCIGIDTIITYVNRGCDTISVDKGNLIPTPGWTVTYPFLPLKLPPDSMFAVHVQLDPVGLGLTTQTFSFDFSQPVEGTKQSTGCYLETRVKVGSGILSVPSSFLEAGSFSFCKGDTALSASISNTGCDTLIVSDLRFTSDGTFTLAATSFDSLLAPRSQSQFRVLFAPRQKGVHRGTLTFHVRNIRGGDLGRDTSIVFEGFGSDGDRAIAIDTKPRDLGTGSFCRTETVTIPFTNTGCDTLTVSNTSLAGNDFIVVSAPKANRKLAPGETDFIQIQYIPTAAGSSSAMVTVASDDPMNPVAAIPVTATSTDREDIGFTAQLTRSGLIVTDTTTLRVYPTGATNVLGLTSVSFDLQYSEDLLTRRSESTGVAGGVLKLGTPQPLPGPPLVKGREVILPVRIEGSDLTLDPKQPIFEAHFLTFLTDTTHTDLKLTNFVLNDDDPQFKKCVLALAESPTALPFTLDLRCGEGMIERQMQQRTPLTEFRIHPNPTSGKVQVDVTANVDGPVVYEVLDVLGVVQRRGELSGGSGGGGATLHAATLHTTLDLSSMAAGSYYLRLSTTPNPSSFKGGVQSYVRTERVVVGR